MAYQTVWKRKFAIFFNISCKLYVSIFFCQGGGGMRQFYRVVRQWICRQCSITKAVLSKGRSKGPFDLPRNDTALVTLCWRDIHHRMTRWNRCIPPPPLWTKHRHTVCPRGQRKWQTSFLDFLVSRDDISLWTTIYKKLMHTSRLLNESSYNPISHRATIIRTLTWRAQLVCNTTDSISNENKHLYRVFSQNNYNDDFIQWNTHWPTTTKTNDTATPTTTATIHKRHAWEHLVHLTTLQYPCRPQTHHYIISVTNQH